MTSKFIPIKLRLVETVIFDNIPEAYDNRDKAEKEGFKTHVDPIIYWFKSTQWKLTLYKEEK